MELFYSNEIYNDHLYLKIEESGHCIKVLRKVTGDLVKVIDGRGNLYQGPIEIENKNKPVKVWIQNKTQFDEKQYQTGFHLAIAPTKNTDRMEWLIEKTVEMGIDSISFLQCERSERTNLRLDRLEKIAVAALKQSQQYWLPKINLPVSFSSYIDSISSNENNYIAHCLNTEKLEFGTKMFNKNCRILIGPEGDFTPSEIDLAISKGYLATSLGKSRLRTETAALYACAVYKSQSI